MKLQIRLALTACFAVLLVQFSLAQSSVITLPLQSQQASVSQRIGVTDITINYHRPLVNGRKVLGGIIPYGQVWRAGANENTTISFSDPVTVEGKALDKGTYGLHMLPAQDGWTVIFSKMATAWGSFTYKEEEDALRVPVKAQAAEFHEALAYDFDEVKPASTVVTMRWEKIAVPFKVEVDVHKAVQESLNHQLRGLPQYTWEGWDDAANYWLTEKTNLEEALKYSDRSIGVEDRFDNEITKSNVLAALGRYDEATALQAKTLQKATPLQVHIFARQLQQQGKQDRAFEIFRKNAKDNPKEWFVHSGMARVYCAQGDYDNAAKEMRIALDGAPDNTKTYVKGLISKLEDKQDINK